MIKFLFIIVLSISKYPTIGQSLSQKLDKYLEATGKTKNKFNGSVLIAIRGEIIINKGYGYKNIVERKYNDSSTIYQIGSITKTFTSAIILRLQETGKLSLTDKISKYIPDYPEGNDISIENLLTHTSGIFEYLQSKEYAKVDYLKPIGIDTLISFFKFKKRLFESGERFSYTNSGYILLAFIIEQILGEKYEQVVREQIFDPLKMTHSGFDLRNLRDTNKAVNYDIIRKKPRVSAPVFDSTHAPGCGGIYSTTRDLYKWDRALYGNMILSQSSLRQAYIPYKSKYGFGWFIDSSFNKFNVFHGGGTPGFRSHLQRFINDDVCIILLSNNSYCDLAEISNRLAAIIFNKTYETLNYE